MSLLSREQILQAVDLEQEDVEVPEWGGSVRVRALTGTERDAFEASMIRMHGNGSRELRLDNARAKLVAMCVIDEDGARLFSDADAAALGAKSASALERVFDVARKLSGLSSDDVEELAEGFADGPSAPATSA